MERPKEERTSTSQDGVPSKHLSTYVIVIGNDVKCWACDLEERLEIGRVRVQVVADQLGTAGCVRPVSIGDRG